MLFLPSDNFIKPSARRCTHCCLIFNEFHFHSRARWRWNMIFHLNTLPFCKVIRHMGGESENNSEIFSYFSLRLCFDIISLISVSLFLILSTLVVLTKVFLSLTFWSWQRREIRLHFVVMTRTMGKLTWQFSFAHLLRCCCHFYLTPWA